MRGGGRVGIKRLAAGCWLAFKSRPIPTRRSSPGSDRLTRVDPSQNHRRLKRRSQREHGNGGANNGDRPEQKFAHIVWDGNSVPEYARISTLISAICSN